MEVSVLTTVKNGDTFILEMLHSVRNQSDVPYEHIIVDDGSTDKTVSIINEFKKEFKNYNIILIETGGIGRGKSLNLGVANANTNWIAIIDADDLWHKMKLKIQKEVLQKNNDIDVLGTNTVLFSENDVTLDVVINDEINFRKLNKQFLFSNQIAHTSVIIKKELCNYDIKRKSQFDYELWLRLRKKGHTIATLDSSLSFHRIHEMQQFESKMKNKYRIRSFKLKMHYSFFEFNIKAIVYNTLKLIFDLTLPRQVRLKIRFFLNSKK